MRFFSSRLPLARNSGVHAAGLPAPDVEFSEPSGLRLDSSGFPFELILGLEEELDDAVIHYCLEPREPTETDPVYERPLSIQATTAVRARAYAKNRLPGRVGGRSFVAIDQQLQERYVADLPVVVVETHGVPIDQDWSREYRPAYAAVFDVDPATGRSAIGQNEDFAGFTAIHVRGQTSASNFPKKQYAWEIRDAAGKNDDAGLLGFSPATDWILHAPYSDKTLMRNVLAYDTSRTMAGSNGGVRTKYVEVFLNQDGGTLNAADFQGTYVLMERLERGRDRVDIAELTEFSNDGSRIDGGYIFKRDKQIYEHPTFVTPEEGLELGIAEPKNPSQQQFQHLRNHVQEFEQVLHSDRFADPETGYRSYIDVDSFIDLHWMVEVFREIDGFRISSYFCKDRGRKIRALPVWDYNLSLGNANYDGGQMPTGWYHQSHHGGGYPWYPRMFRDFRFDRQYWERYFELRRSVFSNEAFIERIDGFADELKVSQRRNFARWPVLGRYVWPNPPGYHERRTYADEVNWMKQWLTTRLAWIDGQHPGPPGFSHYGGVIEAGTKLTLTLPPDPLLEGGDIYYTLDGNDPAVPIEEERHELVDGTALPIEYMVPMPTNGGHRLQIGDWAGVQRKRSAGWKQGKGGVGYEMEPGGDYIGLIGVDVSEMSGSSTSCYIRIPFDLDEPVRDFNRLVLEMRYDDGFVAYLNGTRVVSSNCTSSAVRWNSRATGSVSDRGAVQWQDFDITRNGKKLLRSGKNILAIHGLNRSATSSDALWAARLSTRKASGEGIATSAIRYTEPIPVDHPVTVRAAAKAGGIWGATASAVLLPGAQMASRENLLVSTIHYHPAEPSEDEAATGALAEDFEFIELKNRSHRWVDLSGCRFSHGIDFVFRSLDAGKMGLAPGETGVIVRDPDRYAARYETRGVKVLGTYRGYLHDSGERISFENPVGDELIRIDYDDKSPWPESADGEGPWLKFDGAGVAGLNQAESWSVEMFKER